MASRITTLAQVNLTSAGTAQQISTSTIPAEVVVISAPSANSGSIYIGDSNVASNRYLAVLSPGQRMSIEAGNESGGTDMLDLAEIYFDGDTTNDDIQVGYIARVRNG